MTYSKQIEIDLNFDFFRRKLSDLLRENRGKFALLRSCEVIGFFDGPGDAYRAGLSRFPDNLFSIQEVEDRPAEMGMMGLALD